MNDLERGYVSEPRKTAFTAVVERVEPLDGGTAAVWLDRTFFYPESGGQPADRGTLGGRTVLDVTEDEAGDVRHLLDGPLQEGDGVEGHVDWPRRFDHMQQHSGQHLLSRVILKRLGAATVGFHLGEEVSTIDVEAPALEPAAVAAVEAEANELVWRDLPIVGRTVDRAAYEAHARTTGCARACRRASPRCGSSRSRASISRPAAARTASARANSAR